MAQAADPDPTQIFRARVRSAWDSIFRCAGEYGVGMVSCRSRNSSGCSVKAFLSGLCAKKVCAFLVGGIRRSTAAPSAA